MRTAIDQVGGCILVLEDGDVVEQGNHEELLERGGAYAKLHSLQFGS